MNYEEYSIAKRLNNANLTLINETNRRAGKEVLKVPYESFEAFVEARCPNAKCFADIKMDDLIIPDPDRTIIEEVRKLSPNEVIVEGIAYHISYTGNGPFTHVYLRDFENGKFDKIVLPDGRSVNMIVEGIFQGLTRDEVKLTMRDAMLNRRMNEHNDRMFRELASVQDAVRTYENLKPVVISAVGDPEVLAYPRIVIHESFLGYGSTKVLFQIKYDRNKAIVDIDNSMAVSKIMKSFRQGCVHKLLLKLVDPSIVDKLDSELERVIVDLCVDLVGSNLTAKLREFELRYNEAYGKATTEAVCSVSEYVKNDLKIRFKNMFEIFERQTAKLPKGTSLYIDLPNIERTLERIDGLLTKRDAELMQEELIACNAKVNAFANKVDRLIEILAEYDKCPMCGEKLSVNGTHICSKVSDKELWRTIIEEDLPESDDGFNYIVKETCSLAMSLRYKRHIVWLSINKHTFELSINIDYDVLPTLHAIKLETTMYTEIEQCTKVEKPVSKAAMDDTTFKNSVASLKAAFSK